MESITVVGTKDTLYGKAKESIKQLILRITS